MPPYSSRYSFALSKSTHTDLSRTIVPSNAMVNLPSIVAILATTLVISQASLGAQSFAPSVPLQNPKRQYFTARYAEPSDDHAGGSEGNEPLFSQRPAAVFAQITNGSANAVGLDDLARWGELQELLDDGEILDSEVQSFYDAACRGGEQGLDEAGFEAMYDMIDNLFEDVVEEDSATKEEELIALLTTINRENEESNKLPCGMECKDETREAVSDLIEQLVSSNSNRIATLRAKDLLGKWELLYTSSKAMILNQNLSGLTASGPDQEIRFSGVRQTFTGSKFLGFVEMVETFNRGDPDGEFDVKITGEWELSNKAGALTLEISPEGIEYSSGGRASGMTEAAPVVQMGGGMSQVSEWQSLGPIKLLEAVYSSPDLYIAQGQFESSGVFIWSRVQ